MRDLYSNIGPVLGLTPKVHTSGTEGPAIDLQGFESVCFVVNTGAIAGSGDFGVTVQESDTDSSGDFADADSSVVDNDAPSTLEASSTYKLGYRGHKRYVRLALTRESGTSIAAGAAAVKGHAHERPVD